MLIRYSVNVHLAFFAIELQSELTPVAEAQSEWLTPCRTPSAMLHTVTESIAQAVAALHEWGTVVRHSLDTTSGIECL